MRGTHSDLDVVGLLAETRRNKLEELVLLHGGKSVLRGEDEAHLHLLDGRTLGERERLHLSRREGGLDLNLCHYNIYARVSYEGSARAEGRLSNKSMRLDAGEVGDKRE